MRIPMLELPGGTLGLCASAAVIICGLFTAQPVPAQEAPAPERPEYSLGAGDKLKIVVFGHEDLSGQFEVDGTGAVSLPLVGTVRVGGKTISEAERAVVTALKPDYLKNPRVSLQVLNYRPFYIIGEVKEPGSYPYVNGLTVLEAVAIAGGFTYRAKESKMNIIRAIDSARQPQGARPDTVVLPGDLIEVPQRYF